MTRRSSQSIPLGTVLFDWPAAGRTRAQLPYAPDTWREQFRKHADTAVLRRVFTTCRAGRDWVLANSPHLTLRINTWREHTREEWAARIGRLEQALRTRGALPTCVDIECNRCPHSSVACALLFPLITKADYNVTGLEIRDASLQREEPSRAFSALLQLAAPAATHLTSLTLTEPSTTLPPPSLLPKLQKLEVSFEYMVPGWPPRPHVDSMIRSIAPYVAQLTHLAILDNQLDLPFRWMDLLTAPSNTLTHFRIDGTIKPGLVRLLAQHVPALTHLKACDIEVKTNSLVGLQWGLEELALTYDEADLTDATRLPRQREAGAKLLVHAECQYGQELQVEDVQGLPRLLMSRLPELVFDVSTFYVMPSEDLPQADHGQALHAVLQQLQHLQIEKYRYTIDLYGWALEPTAPPATHAPLEPLPHPRFDLHTEGPLSEELLGMLTQVTTKLQWMSVGSIARVDSDQYASLPWLSEHTTIDTVKVAHLLRLPHPGGKGAPRTVTCKELEITPDVRKVGVQALCDWLQHVRWSPRNKPGITITVESWPNSTHNTLSAELTVLKAVSLQSEHTERNTQIVLCSWELTNDVMQALKGLPDWPAKLVFESCTFPLAASEYTQLAECMPASYTEWCFDSACTFSVLHSICNGVDERRRGSEGAPLRLAWSEHRGGDERVGECVMLVKTPEQGDDE